MSSKRQSVTRKTNKPRKDEVPVFVLDENLGTRILPSHLRAAGFEVRTFSGLGMAGEQDPWAFYYCGKNNYCLITSDKKFMDPFTHMAAIQLGKARIFAFTSGDENMNRRAAAFVKAKPKILRLIKRQQAPFVASIGLSAEVILVDEKPMPTRKYCRPEHWESYVKVCKAEGVEIHEDAHSVPGSEVLGRGLKGRPGADSGKEHGEFKAFIPVSSEFRVSGEIHSESEAGTEAKSGETEKKGESKPGS